MLPGIPFGRCSGMLEVDEADVAVGGGDIGLAEGLLGGEDTFSHCFLRFLLASLETRLGRTFVEVKLAVHYKERTKQEYQC